NIPRLPAPPHFPYTPLFRSARIASSASLFGRPVLTPTTVPSASTSSSRWRYFRPGPSCSEIQMREPGAVKPRIEPVLGQEPVIRSEEHTSELQSREKLVCRL